MANMVIELLKCKVKPKFRAHYLQKDSEIWTTALAKCPGFLGKEVWLNPNVDSEIIIIVRWATRKQWKSIPDELLEQIEQEFVEQTGHVYEIVESLEYQMYESV